MLFSIIYSVDWWAKDGNVDRFAPPRVRKWDLTEEDDGFEFDYLCEGRQKIKGRHRKWCVILDKKQFIEFVDHLGLVAEDIETMGSFGALGFGFSWAPAISFRGDDEHAICQNAYVTPLMARPDGEPIRKKGANERDWDRVRKAVLRRFG